MQQFRCIFCSLLFCLCGTKFDLIRLARYNVKDQDLHLLLLLLVVTHINQWKWSLVSKFMREVIDVTCLKKQSSSLPHKYSLFYVPFTFFSFQETKAFRVWHVSLNNNAVVCWTNKFCTLMLSTRASYQLSANLHPI